MQFIIGNTRKEPAKKCNNIEHHVKNKDDMQHQHVKIFCGMANFPELQFCGLNTKPHGVPGLGKRYNVFFDPKLSHEKCDICRIPCACMYCTTILDQPWVTGMEPKIQPCYRYVLNCTY